LINAELTSFKPAGSPEKPVVAFHTIEKIRVKEGSGGVQTITRKGNFNQSSRQMEHAILIDLLDQVIPVLEESDIMLDVTVDGDLDTNKTLTNVSVVHQVFADLKHLTRNIRKNLGSRCCIILESW
jgi:hypothetical protein